jgi:hypothetical protein
VCTEAEIAITTATFGVLALCSEDARCRLLPTTCTCLAASSNADEQISEAYVALGRLNHVSKKHKQEVLKLQATLQAAIGASVAEAQDRIEKEVMAIACSFTA